MVGDGTEGAVENEPRKPETPSEISRKRADASEKPADARTGRDSSSSGTSIDPQELERLRKRFQDKLRKRFQERLRAPEVNQNAMPLDWSFPGEAPGIDAPATRSSPERGKLRAVRSHSSSPLPLSLDSPAEPTTTDGSQGMEAPAKLSPFPIPSITITQWQESSVSNNSTDGRGELLETSPTTGGGQASSTKSSSGVQEEEPPAATTDLEQTGSNGSDLVNELHRRVRIRVQRRPDKNHLRMQRERFLREAIASGYESNRQPQTPFWNGPEEDVGSSW
jgi:hypothetical protein